MLNIIMRDQCLTVMDEYEGKSVEEIRLEDYEAGRNSGWNGNINNEMLVILMSKNSKAISLMMIFFLTF